MKRGISVNKINKTFLNTKGTKVCALSEVTFEPLPGKITALLGPSGCGKSTLLNIIAGFETADSGEVCLKQCEGKRPCMVFQSPALFDWLTVLKNVEFGLRRQRIPTKEREKLVEEILDLVELKDFIHSYPHELSGGMQQRVALARVLVLQPDVLLMDEPFAALDAQLRGKMQDLLLEIWEKLGLTILFVTHDIEEALRLAHQVVVFTARPGRIDEVIEVEEENHFECRRRIQKSLLR